METLTQGEQMAVTAVAGGFLGASAAIAIAIYVLLVIADWKIFTKAGEKGWKSIIPIYNIYISFKIVGMKVWFWPLLIISLVQSIISSVAGEQATVTLIAGVIAAIIGLVAYILFCGKTAKAFGKGTGYAVGIFFFPNIFTLILGFGSAKYEGIQE